MTLVQAAERLLLAVGDAAVKNAATHSQYLQALDLYMDSQILTISAPNNVAEEAKEFLRVFGSHYMPQAVLAAGQQAQSIVTGAGVQLESGRPNVCVLGSDSDVEHTGAISDEADIRVAIEALSCPTELQL